MNKFGSIRLFCLGCQKQLRVKREFCGKHVKCPCCAGVFVVPDGLPEDAGNLPFVPRPGPGARPNPLTTAPLLPKLRELLWQDIDGLEFLRTAIQARGHRAASVCIGDASVTAEGLTTAHIDWAIGVVSVTMQGEQSAREGKYKEALATFIEGLDYAPGSDILLMNIASVHHQMGNDQQALAYLERAHHIAPNNPRIKANLDEAKLKAAAGRLANQLAGGIAAAGPALLAKNQLQHPDKIQEVLRMVDGHKAMIDKLSGLADAQVSSAALSEIDRTGRSLRQRLAPASSAETGSEQARHRCACGKYLRVPPALHGKRVRCPACKRVHVIKFWSSEPEVPTQQSGTHEKGDRDQDAQLLVVLAAKIESINTHQVSGGSSAASGFLNGLRSSLETCARLMTSGDINGRRWDSFEAKQLLFEQWPEMRRELETIVEPQLTEYGRRQLSKVLLDLDVMYRRPGESTTATSFQPEQPQRMPGETVRDWARRLSSKNWGEQAQLAEVFLQGGDKALEIETYLFCSLDAFIELGRELGKKKEVKHLTTIKQHAQETIPKGRTSLEEVRARKPAQTEQAFVRLASSLENASLTVLRFEFTALFHYHGLLRHWSQTGEFTIETPKITRASAASPAAPAAASHESTVGLIVCAVFVVGFCAWTLYLVRDGFTWWSLLTGGVAGLFLLGVLGLWLEKLGWIPDSKSESSSTAGKPAASQQHGEASDVVHEPEADRLPDTWYYARDGKKRLGPFTAKQLKELAKAGQLLQTDMLWRQGTRNWVPGDQVKSLFGADALPSHDTDDEDGVTMVVIGCECGRTVQATFANRQPNKQIICPKCGRVHRHLDNPVLDGLDNEDMEAVLDPHQERTRRRRGRTCKRCGSPTSIWVVDERGYCSSCRRDEPGLADRILPWGRIWTIAIVLALLAAIVRVIQNWNVFFG